MTRWIALAGLCVAVVFLFAGPSPGGGGAEDGGAEDGGADEGENRDLQDIFDRVPTDELIGRYPIAAYEQLLELMESGVRIVGQDAYRAAERNLEETLDHLARLKSNPSYRDEYSIRRFVHVHPVFSRFEHELVASPPYYIFVECDETGRSGDAYAHDLGALLAEYRSLFAERFDLPAFEELTDPTERTLKFFVFRKPGSFDAYQKSIRRPLPPGVGAYYMPSDQWIVINDHRSGEAGGNQRHLVFHDAVHQLVHQSTKVTLEKLRGGESVLWTDPATHSNCHWFQEGLAEFLCATKEREDGGLEFLALHPVRTRELELTAQRKLSFWPLRELLKIRSGGEMMRIAAAKGLGHQGRLASLFYAQAWKWFHFLWFFDDGKYREKLLSYMAKELSGVSGPDEFEKHWFGDEPVDWSAIEAEWLAYEPK